MESTSRRQVFSSFLECSQVTGVFYHSVIHGLGFFICFIIWILHAQNDKTRFFYVLYLSSIPFPSVHCTSVLHFKAGVTVVMYALRFFSNAWMK